MQKAGKRTNRKWMKIVSVMLALMLAVGSYTPVTVRAEETESTVSEAGGTVADSAGEIGQAAPEAATESGGTGTGKEDAGQAEEIASNGENAGTVVSGADNAGEAGQVALDAGSAGIEGDGTGAGTEDAGQLEEAAQDSVNGGEENNDVEPDLADDEAYFEAEESNEYTALEEMPAEDEICVSFEEELLETGVEEDIISVTYEGMPTNETHMFKTYAEAETWMDGIDETDGKSRDYTITYLNETNLKGLTVTSLTSKAKSITLASDAHWDQNKNEGRDVHAFVLRNISTQIPLIFQTEVRIENESDDTASFDSIVTYARVLMQGTVNVGDLTAIDDPAPQNSYDKAHLSFMGDKQVNITHLTMGAGQFALNGFEPIMIDTFDLAADRLDAWWLGGNIREEGVSYIFFKTKTDLSSMDIKFSNNVSNAVEKIVYNNDGTWQLEIKKDDTRHFRITCDGTDHDFVSWAEALRWMEETMNNASKDYIVTPINYDPNATNSYYWEHVDKLPEKARSITFNKVADGSDPQSRFYYYLNSQKNPGDHIKCAVILNAHMHLDNALVYDDLTLNGIELHLERNFTVGNLTLENKEGSPAGFTSGTFGTFGQPGYDFGRLTITGTLTGKIQFFSLPDSLRPGDALITYGGKLEQNSYHVQGDYAFEVKENKDGTTSLVVAGGGGGAGDPSKPDNPDTPSKPGEETITPPDTEDTYYKYEETEKTDIGTAAIAAIKDKVYDGRPYLPAVKVTISVNGKNTVLTEGADYRVLYEKNVNAGTGKVIIKGNGLYKGTKEATFKITEKSMTKLKAVAGSMMKGASGQPVINIYDGSTLLVPDKDYKLELPSGMTASTGKKSVKAAALSGGNYKGSLTVKISVIEPKKNAVMLTPENTDVSLSSDSMVYTGSQCKPAVTVKYNGKALTLKTDYTVKYTNNINTGTAYVTVTGKAGYCGSIIKTFVIAGPSTSFQLKKEISTAKYTYNGKLQKPKVTVQAVVKNVAGTDKKKTLKAGKDYIITYRNNLHANQAAASDAARSAVIIKGIGNYAGINKEFYFTIQPQQIKKAAVKGTKQTGLVLTYAKKTLQPGVDYDKNVIYGDEKKGKIAVTIKGLGDFAGSEVTKSVKVQ